MTGEPAFEVTWRAAGMTAAPAEEARRGLPRDVVAGADVAESDAALVPAAQVDPRAFAPLYERYVDRVYRYCLRRLGDEDEAADATAQTFTRALAALPRFQVDPERPGATFRSWLFAIAHNVVVDAERRRGRGPRSIDLDESLEASDAMGRLVDAEPSPEEWAVASDEGRRLRAVLLRLSERQRRVVELRLAGLTGAEIAASLEMSVGAVKVTQFRAYARLRTLLNEQSDATDDEGPRGGTD